MAGENAARLVRDKSRALAMKYSREARREGQIYQASVLAELAEEIAAIPISGE